MNKIYRCVAFFLHLKIFYRVEKMALMEKNSELLKKLKNVWFSYKKHCPDIHKTLSSPTLECSYSSNDTSNSQFLTNKNFHLKHFTEQNKNQSNLKSSSDEISNNETIINHIFTYDNNLKSNTKDEYLQQTSDTTDTSNDLDLKIKVVLLSQF